ncbi:MAG: hypothetical protein B7733_04220 [Myxococcales bacterium FL481]|nr:MAG: hypothetical protein B7733_04220 [Myxococcales bacterium FL481]
MLLSASAAATLAVSQRATWIEATVLAAAGTLGSLLPDVDADRSVPSRVIRHAAAGAVAIVVGLGIARYRDLTTTLVAGWLTLVAVRFLLGQIVRRFTTHRGIVHSVPFGALLGLVTVLAAHRGLDVTPRHAWWLGSFVTGGFVVHLVLDEVASVDLTSVRVKRSFGSALKFGSSSSRVATGLLYAALSGTAWYCPSAHPFAREAAGALAAAASAMERD